MVSNFGLNGEAAGLYIAEIHFSPDSKYLGVLNSEGYIYEDGGVFRLFSTTSWKELQNSKRVFGFSFSPKNEIALVYNGSTQIHNLAAWDTEKSLPIGFGEVFYSLDGKKLIFVWGIGLAANGSIKVANAENGEVMYEISPQQIIPGKQFQYACDDPNYGYYDPPEYSPPAIRAVKVSPDGKTFAVQYDYDGNARNSVRIFRLDDGDFVDEYIGDNIRGFDFSPNGHLLALNMSQIGAVHIWDLRNKTLVDALQAFETPVYDLKLSPDGRWLAVGYGDETQVRRMTDGSMIRNDHGAIAFSPFGKRVAVGTYDGMVYEEDINGAHKTFVSDEEGWIYDMVYSGEGALITTSDKCNVRVWDSANGQLIKQLQSPIVKGWYEDTTRVAVGRLITSSDGLHLVGFNIFGGITVWNLQGNTQVNFPEEVSGFVIAISSQDVIALGNVGSVDFFDIVGSKLPLAITIPPHTDYSYIVTALAFSNNGQLLAVGLDNGSIYIYSFPDLGIVDHFQAHNYVSYDGLYQLIFTSDDQELISGGADGTVKIWGIP